MLTLAADGGVAGEPGLVLRTGLHRFAAMQPKPTFRTALAAVASLGILAVAAPASSAADFNLALKPFAEGFVSPLSLAPLPDGRMMLVDQAGQLHVLDADGKAAAEPVFDFRPKLAELKKGFDERGLLDVALHPKFAENRKLVVVYSGPKQEGAPADWDHTMVVSEFKLPAGDVLKLDEKSERVLLRIDKPFFNHNGGRIAFGPDGFLYIGVGDGGSANDVGKRPETGNGQNLQTHMGKVLRVDIDKGSPYAIPSDNPFADGKAGKPEIFAYGLRNPWGLSFDMGGSKELFLADVGQDLFEEVDIIKNGGNYGWNLREGFQGFDPKKPKTVPENAATKGARGEALIDPIFEYPHRPASATSVAGISITGGYVYRGKAIKGLQGRYVFGDWSRSGAPGDGRIIIASKPESGSKWSVEYPTVNGTAAGRTGAYVIGFGQDASGELYVMSNTSSGLTGKNGKVWKLVSADAAVAAVK